MNPNVDLIQTKLRNLNPKSSKYNKLNDYISMEPHKIN